MPKPDVSDERIPQILNAAIQVFSQRGIDGASMSQIAKAANVSKAMIYYYFESKDAMVEALVHRLFDEDQAELDALIADETPAMERLTLYINGLVELLDANESLYPVLRSSKHGQPVRTRFTRFYASILCAISTPSRRLSNRVLMREKSGEILSRNRRRWHSRRW